MAKILGEPGKISLKFCSGTGMEFKQKFSLTNLEVAAFLQRSCREIESGGKVEVAYGSVSLSVNPAVPIKLEVEYEEDELQVNEEQGEALIDPAVRHGKPIIKGTRVPLQ